MAAPTTHVFRAGPFLTSTANGDSMATAIFDDMECVLLDIDGTLVDSNEYHVDAWAEAFKRHAQPVEKHAIRKQIGKGGDQLIPSLRADLADAEREQIAATHDEIFGSRYLPQVRAFAGATQLVESLHARGINVVLASSANRREVDHYTALLGIEQFIVASTCADDVANSKPAGDIFATALKKVTSATPERALVIGDTPYDVIAAAKCKIATLALLSGGFSEDELRQAGARAVYKGVGDVLALLQGKRIATA